MHEREREQPKERETEREIQSELDSLKHIKKLPGNLLKAGSASMHTLIHIESLCDAVLVFVLNVTSPIVV